MKSIVRKLAPAMAYRPILTRWRSWRRPTVPAGGPAGVEPVSQIWGLDRGSPIDRYYLGQFFAAHASDIRGRVLETGDARYTREFGGPRVTRSDVLHRGPGNRDATLTGDLVTGVGIPAAAFDCIILINTLSGIFDCAAALRTCRRALAPSGVLLASFTGIAPISPIEYGPPNWSGDGDQMRFTAVSARRTSEQAFPAKDLTVTAYGNVRSATAFLYGLAAEELSAAELSYRDPRYDLLVVIRAVRSSVP